jgi:hypothetical protein
VQQSGRVAFVLSTDCNAARQTEGDDLFPERKGRKDLLAVEECPWR